MPLKIVNLSKTHVLGYPGDAENTKEIYFNQNVLEIFAKKSFVKILTDLTKN